MRNIIDKLIMIVCLVAATISGSSLWDVYAENIHREEELDRVKQSVIADEEEGQPFNINWPELQAQNPDVIGWVYVPGTGVSYPVVQSANNDFYLNANFYGMEDPQGCPFLDNLAEADFSADNSLIYGHSVAGSNSMFSGLRNYKEASFFDSHPYFYILTPSENYKVDVLAFVGTTYNIDFYNVYFSEPEVVIQDMLQRAIYYNENVDYRAGELVSLSTCDLEYGLDSDMRLLLTGVKNVYEGEILYEG